MRSTFARRACLPALIAGTRHCGAAAAATKTGCAGPGLRRCFRRGLQLALALQLRGQFKRSRRDIGCDPAGAVLVAEIVTMEGLAADYAVHEMLEAQNGA